MQQLAKGFWTLRGDFRVAGVVNIGTQMSLVRRKNGRFLLLDSYHPDADDLHALLDVTEGGTAIDAVLNLHPFHTVHCEAIARLCPNARHFGTRRHHKEVPEIAWDPQLIEDPASQNQFADDLDFSIPSGLDFVSDDNKVHVSSILARHRRSGIVHVDDTFVVWDPPALVEPILPAPRLRFHPMLSKALKKEPGAADAFARWAMNLASEWADTRIVCAAHSAVYELEPESFEREVLSALQRVEGTLDAHRADMNTPT
ncbi:MAG: hypothetical protein AAF291_09865 [Pseudomonadota bacterium]